MKAAEKILNDLIAGNQRFLQGSTKGKAWQGSQKNTEQSPKASVLGCSDSRVPVEIVFDQDPGDLFVIRVAGNIAGASQIGSIEYAAEQFNVPLVIVLGHTDCGAIKATMMALQNHNTVTSENLGSIVDHIAPAISELCSTNTSLVDSQQALQCLQANIRASAKQLTQDSTILADLTASKQLTVISAYYDIETGTVNIID